MSSLVIKNIVRFILAILLQGLFFISIGLNYPILDKMVIIIYPIAIMLLPIRTPKSLIVFLGFILGTAIDFFYTTPGINAAASVFMAFIRPYLLAWLEHRGGYQVESVPVPKEFGFKWFFYYASIFMGIHLFILFSIQHFTFAFIFEIILKTIESFIASMIFILIYILIFNPEE